jgi:hypothetical protein
LSVTSPATSTRPKRRSCMPSSSRSTHPLSRS